jgi:hypothetical protein
MCSSVEANLASPFTSLTGAVFGSHPGMVLLLCVVQDHCPSSIELDLLTSGTRSDKGCASPAGTNQKHKTNTKDSHSAV